MSYIFFKNLLCNELSFCVCKAENKTCRCVMYMLDCLYINVICKIIVMLNMLLLKVEAVKYIIGRHNLLFLVYPNNLFPVSDIKIYNFPSRAFISPHIANLSNILRFLCKYCIASLDYVLGLPCERKW